ncbi:hypothetical protein BDDG_13388, partial [Blastomyces dermatitidis ATCC 18188]
SSYIDRFISVNDSELNVESLIENLKNVIMKKLSVLYMTESSISLSAFSVSFSVTLSQSSTSASVSDSPALSTSVSVTSTSATPGFTISAFVISSSCFKEMLHRLNELYLSKIIMSFTVYEVVKDICVFRNENMNIVYSFTPADFLVASVSEIILIEDDNTTETTLFYSQASLITFSFFSAEKIVHTLSY